MKNKPLKIATCCLAGTLLTTVPAYNVMAAPASAIVESELNTSSTSAGVSKTVIGYLERNLA